jgi:hypothetical protein
MPARESVVHHRNEPQNLPALRSLLFTTGIAGRSRARRKCVGHRSRFRYIIRLFANRDARDTSSRFAQRDAGSTNG